MKKYPNAHNDPRDPLAVMYHNAQMLLASQRIENAAKRRDAIQKTYEEICLFMRYFHGLAKKAERRATPHKDNNKITVQSMTKVRQSRLIAAL